VSAAAMRRFFKTVFPVSVFATVLATTPVSAGQIPAAASSRPNDPVAATTCRFEVGDSGTYGNMSINLN